MQANPYSKKTPQQSAAHGRVLVSWAQSASAPHLGSLSYLVGLLQRPSLGEAWHCLEEPQDFEGEELGAFATLVAICSGEGI